MKAEQMERRILRLESRLKFLAEEFNRCVKEVDLDDEQASKLAALVKRRLAEEMSS